MKIVDFSLRFVAGLYSVPLRLFHSDVILLLPGCKVATPRSELRETILNYEHIYVYRDYERLEEFIPGGSERVIDLGGYLGLYSIRSLRSGSRVRAFIVEANPLLCKYIFWNLRLNKVEDRAKVLCIAVDSSKGIEWFYVGESLVNSSLNHHYVEDFSNVREALKVPKLTLSEVLGRSGFRKIDLIKMDIEGVEERVLASSLDALNAYDVEKLVVELHDNYYSFTRISKILADRYHLFLYTDESIPYQSFLYAVSKR